MIEWWKQILRGPIPVSFGVCALFGALATWLAPSSDGAPEASARFYDMADARDPRAGDAVTSVPVGVHDSASVHHLRVATSVKRHFHRRHDQTVTVLTGRGTVRLGDEARDVGPGAVLLIPRGTWHSLDVTDGPMEAIGVFSPPFDGKDRHFVDE